MKNTNIIIGVLAVGAIAAVAYFTTGKTVEQKKQYLLSLGESTAFNQMSDQEVKDSYEYITEYVLKKKSLVPGDFRNRIMIIGERYNIFN